MIDHVIFPDGIVHERRRISPPMTVCNQVIPDTICVSFATPTSVGLCSKCFPVKAQASGIETTLAERGSRYGKFTDHARVTQNLKTAMKDSPQWDVLSDDQAEALEMIQHKIARILCGDPDFHDSWHDIVGYAKLVADRLASLPHSANLPE